MESKFKVGDKVRVVKHCNLFGDSIAMSIPIGSERRIIKKLGCLDYEGIETFSLYDTAQFYMPVNVEPVATASPIHTVMRREIVPGVYGKVLVNECGKGGGITGVEMRPTVNPTDLREAARIFTEIADALDENMRAAA